MRLDPDGTYRYILNLAPEVKFSNVLLNNNLWSTWKERAKESNKAAALVRRYLHRPAEELYNDEVDPYNMENLAGQKKYDEIKEKLRDKLFNWMKKNGDEGLFTELLAFERQGGNKANGDSVIVLKKLHDSRRASDTINTGFDYALFSGSWSKFPDVSSLDHPARKGTISQISADIEEELPQTYGIQYNGNVQVPQRGYYSFYMKTGQAGKLYVDDKLVVATNNDTQNFGRYGIIGLMPGNHTIRVEYFNKNAPQDDLKVQWSGPNMKRQEL